VPSSGAETVGGTDSLSFRRSWLILFIIGTSEFHVLPLGFGGGFTIFLLAGVILAGLNGEWLWIPLLFVCFFWLPMAVFGGFMSWMISREYIKLTVSGQQIRLRRLIRRSQSIDVGSLDRIVAYGHEPRTLAFLPKVGPPLLSLDAGDWPSEMPDAIGKHLGVQIDRLGDVDKAELRAKYPRNAKEAGQLYELDTEWRGRSWEW
jgi:energy-coupling factor transporter transmembrane protein EcfT